MYVAGILFGMWKTHFRQRFQRSAFLVLGGVAASVCAGQTPFIPVRPSALTQTLEKAFVTQATVYLPRTRHFLRDGRPRFTNRLILEQAPYFGLAHQRP